MPNVAFPLFPFQSEERGQSTKDFRLKLLGRYADEQLSGLCPAWEGGAMPLCFDRKGQCVSMFSTRKWRFWTKFAVVKSMHQFIPI